MKETDTSMLPASTVTILNKLTNGGPETLEEANDMLWDLAGVIDRKMALIKTLEGLVNRKQLTGLLNDRGFDEEIEKEDKRVYRGQSQGGVVVSIDLAGFKRINDNYNMQVGDQALQKFAEVIKNFGFRDTDIIGNPGGDEFVIVITDTKLDYPMDVDGLSKEFANTNNLWGKIDALGKATHAIPFEFEYEGNTVTESISARISVSDYDGKTPIKDALACADEKAKLIKKFTKQYVVGGR